MTGDTLVCPLLNADPVYAHGVEFGMLYCRMRDSADPIADYFTREPGPNPAARQPARLVGRRDEGVGQVLVLVPAGKKGAGPGMIPGPAGDC